MHTVTQAQACRRYRAERVHVLRPAPMVIGGEKTFFYAKFAYCDFECLEVADFIYHRCGFMFLGHFLFLSYIVSVRPYLFAGSGFLQPEFG